MNGVSGAGARPAVPAASDEQRLRKVARDMEGMFVQELFRAMRETVPQEGVIHGGAGEEMFRGMMDEHLASMVPENWDNGLSAAIYRQLQGALRGAEPDAAATTGAGDSH